MAGSETRKLGKNISFRLPAENYDHYQGLALHTGMSVGALIRKRVIEGEATVIVGKDTQHTVSVEELERMAAAARVVKTKRVVNSDDKRRALFLLNKTSNNINQLAHRANADHLADKINAGTYADILYQLERIQRLLKQTLPYVD
jgi:predicted DNA-binding protein